MSKLHHDFFKSDNETESETRCQIRENRDANGTVDTQDFVEEKKCTTEGEHGC